MPRLNVPAPVKLSISSRALITKNFCAVLQHNIQRRKFKHLFYPTSRLEEMDKVHNDFLLSEIKKELARYSRADFPGLSVWIERDYPNFLINMRCTRWYVTKSCLTPRGRVKHFEIHDLTDSDPKKIWESPKDISPDDLVELMFVL